VDFELDFTRTVVIDKQLELRAERPGLNNFQQTFNLVCADRKFFELLGTLRTEAAVNPSAGL